ncbi:hypothetical protein [Neisseria sp. Ec49-e6-T10]|uniref:hypothetical protein n=1 Tax=Neisseria sp. Ec49-e6-T10 TaxID=3140744 RepID=UPI003EBE0574
MKKLILLPLLFLSPHVFSRVPSVPTLCEFNKWETVYIPTKHLGDKQNIVCILPDGNYYFAMDIRKEYDGKYQHLFDQYSKRSPTKEQIVKAMIEMVKAGLFNPRK